MLIISPKLYIASSMAYKRLCSCFHSNWCFSHKNNYIETNTCTCVCSKNDMASDFKANSKIAGKVSIFQLDDVCE